MSSWVRLWHDMPTDPKFRTIARAAGQPLATVVAVFVVMMTDASSNAAERGRTQANDEDIASALDLAEDVVSAIRNAMQGRVLDGEQLTGWSKRQPLREDGSAERGRAFREKRKRENAAERERTNGTEGERPDTDTDTEKKEEPSGSSKEPARPAAAKRGTRVDGFEPDIEWAVSEGLPLAKAKRSAQRFLNHWKGKAGKDATKVDWPATWRNWVWKDLDGSRPAGPEPTDHYGDLRDDPFFKRELAKSF